MRDLIPLIWIGVATPWRGMTVWITFLQFRVLFGQDRSFIGCIRHIMNRNHVLNKNLSGIIMDAENRDCEVSVAELASFELIAILYNSISFTQL